MPLPNRLSVMQHPDRLRSIRLLLAGAALASTLTGCAVPVADGYGYDTYDGYGPAYPAAGYVAPGTPPVVYGAPPLIFGGQVWIDSTHHRPPRRWHDRPNWRDGHHWRGGGWNGPQRPHGGHDGQGPRPYPRPPMVQGPNTRPPGHRPWSDSGVRPPRPNHGWGSSGHRGAREFP